MAVATARLRPTASLRFTGRAGRRPPPPDHPRTLRFGVGDEDPPIQTGDQDEAGRVRARLGLGSGLREHLGEQRAVRVETGLKAAFLSTGLH